MKQAKQRPKVKRHRTQFALADKNAQKVYLVGDFNEWNEKKHLMKKEAGGVWKKTILLAPGHYEYKFLVDGEVERRSSQREPLPQPLRDL